MNHQIKEATTDKAGNTNRAINLTAHALWGAVEAYAGNRNVAAGAAGAAAGEGAAGIISQILYEKSPDKLSQEEKRTVSTLSQAAASIAGGTLANNADGALIAAKTAKDAVENNAQAPIFGNVTPEIVQRAQGEVKVAETKAYIDKVMREEHPIIMQATDDLYAIMSATGKVIYVTREVLIEVAPLVAGGPVAGALRAGKAVQFVATHPRVVTLSEKAMEGVTKMTGKAKELMSEGIYYSYNPTQAKVVQTAVQGIEQGLQPLTKITGEQYIKQAAVGTGVSATAQYAVNGKVDPKDAVKTGLMTPYMLNAPAGMAVLMGSVDTAISAATSGKSQLNEQIKYGESTLGSYGAEKLSPAIIKSFSPIIGSFTGEVINQWNNKSEKEGEK